MIAKIDHIGIAVNNLEEAIKVYTEALGLKVGSHGEAPPDPDPDDDSQRSDP